MKSAYNYPILKKVVDLYEKKNKDDLKGIHILACQHLLEPQAKMFEMLVSFGIPKENIQIFGKIYSTSIEVVEQLTNDAFIVSSPVFIPEKSFDIQHTQNCNNEFERFILSLNKNSSKIIILDDGGELLKTVQGNFNKIPNNIAVIGIEQTSSGFRKLENSVLKFPIFNVARSDKKLLQESPFICSLGCQRVLEVFEKYEIKDPKILIVGLGPIGSNMFSMLQTQGYSVVGYDINNSQNQDLFEFIKESNINVVIGATGSSILNESQVELLNETLDYSLYFISMSSSDREFPASYIRTNSSQKSVHSDIIFNKIILVNNGFPITFKGNVYESSPQEIELTITLLLGSILEASTSQYKENIFLSVPEKVISLL